MIVCCGEALIDMLPAPLLLSEAAKQAQTNPSEQPSTHGFRPIAGGAIFNTAIGLGRLGETVALVSGVSKDLFGEQLVASLSASQVNCDYLIRSKQPTTLAFVTLKDGHASYHFYDENSAGNSITDQHMPTLEAAANCLFFGGISLMGEPAADAYANFAVSHASHNVIMVDPNIRTSFIINEVTYRQRLQKLFACADLIKVSDEDLAWLVPQQSDQEILNESQQVQKLATKMTKLVIVTHGSEGVVGYLLGADKAIEIITCPATKATVADTVGAGDTFNAGFLASLSQQGVLDKQNIVVLSKQQVQNAFDLATKVAAVTVSRTGANPPWLDEL